MKVEKLIPEVYYSQSRDFSYIGRLMEIIFNYMKTSSDCVAVNPDSLNIDATQIELIALSLGFESKHKYTTRDLIYVISSFSELMKTKGTKSSITNAIKLLMTSQKIKLNLLEDQDFILMKDEYLLDIKIPSQMTDTILLDDIFDYILPAGMLYRFNRVEPQLKNKTTSSIASTQSPEYISSYDTSFLADTAAADTYSYVLLLAQPADWETAYGTYYKYITDRFVQNIDTTYVPETFFVRQPNLDVETIITGTVAES